MDNDSITILLLALTTIAISFYILTQPSPDVHPLVLSTQSNVASVRFNHQSPVYTNPLCAHRFIDGLQVQRKGSYHIHPGDLRDIWALFDNSLSRLRVVEYDINDHTLTPRIMALSCLIRVMESSSTVTIALPAHPLHLLMAIFACSFANKTAGLYSSSLTQSHHSSLIITDSNSLKSLQTTNTTTTTIILVDDNNTNHPSAIPWDKATAYSESTPTPPDLDLPLSNKIAISTTTTTHFTHQNITAAVACQLKLLSSIKYPPITSSSSTTNALILQPLSDIYGLVMTLYFMTANAVNTIYLSSNPESRSTLDSIISTISPCALVAPTPTLKSALASSSSSTTWVKKYLLKRNLNDLAHGKLPSSPVISNSHLSVIITRRAIGSSHAHSIPLTPQDLSYLRALYACPLVYGLTVSDRVAGPICQTNTWDYRSGGSHFGPPLPSLEMKLDHYNDDSGQGQLQVCGFTVAEKPPTEWTGLHGLVGKFASDGCLELV